MVLGIAHPTACCGPMREVLIVVAGRIGKAFVRVVVFLFVLVALALGVDVAGALLFRYPPVLIFVLHELPFRGERFDPGRWAEAGSCAGLSDGDCVEKEADCPRGGMVRDLVGVHLVPGKATREKVAGLIGPAKHHVEIEGRTCDAYALGMCSGLRWDYDSLYVCYGEDGTVAKAGHVQH
jgi:hypothetical protein